MLSDEVLPSCLAQDFRHVRGKTVHEIAVDVDTAEAIRRLQEGQSSEKKAVSVSKKPIYCFTVQSP